MSTIFSNTGYTGYTSVTYNPTWGVNILNTTGNILTSPYNGTVTWDKNIYPSEVYNKLKNLSYSIEFEIDKDDILKNNIKSIKNKKISFNCNYIGNRIQPYEFIMKLIDEEKKFSIKVKVSDILSICYKNFQFIKIENNLNFNTNCDFSVIKVKFKYDEIVYQNHKLSLKELRSDKIKKIMSEE